MRSRCALRAGSASRSPQPGDVKAGARGSVAVPAALLPLRSASRCPPGARQWGQRREASRAAASGLQRPRRALPRLPASFAAGAPELISDAAVGVGSRRAGDHPGPGSLRGTLSLPRRPRSSRTRSAGLESRTGHSTRERLGFFPISVIST